MTTPTHGGRREGAGRKQKFDAPSRMIYIRLPESLIRALDRMEGTRTDVIYRILSREVEINDGGH